MGWLQCIVYAFISGIAEFLPISAPAHATVLQYLFGLDSVSPLLLFFVRLGTLLAVFVTSREYLHRFRAERNLNKRSARKRRNFANTQVKTESALVRTAAIVLVISCLFQRPAGNWSSALNICAVMLLINGVLLFVLPHLPRRHKEVRAMTPLDGILIGVSGWLAVFSGISRVGITTTVASLRGAGMGNAYKWSLLISIPVLAISLVLDLVAVFSGGIAFSFGLLIQSLIGCFFAYIGAYLSIQAIRALLQKGELSGFAFYCWGAALFSFILFLI